MIDFKNINIKNISIRMINIKPRHKIAAGVILLVLVAMLILNSFMARKPALSAAATVTSKKVARPAGKNNKIIDANQVSDSNKPAKPKKEAVSSALSDTKNKKAAKVGKPAGKKAKIADGSQISDSNMMADVPKTKKNVKNGKPSSKKIKIADDNEVSDGDTATQPTKISAVSIITDANGNIFVDANSLADGNDKASDSNAISDANKTANAGEGVPSPDITLHTIDGGEISLASLRGKKVILDFWATWCAPCKAEIPHFVKIRSDISPDELVIIGVSSESADVLRKFAEENGINYPVASESNLPAPYNNIKAIPTTFFINSKGVVQKVLRGYQELDVLRATAMSEDGIIPNLAASSPSLTLPTNTVPQAKTEPADLSMNLGTVQSGIQSLVFIRNMPIVDALQLLAGRYSKNIIPSPKVGGTLNFTRLNNVSFDEAMNAILGSDYQYSQQGNIIRVYPADEYQGSEMTCKVFTLYYITAAEAKKLIIPVMSKNGKIEVTTAAQTGVPTGGTVTASGGGDAIAINDMVIIYDYPDRIAKAEQIIAAIDARPKQILIEATILTAALTDDMQLGVDWRNLERSVVTGLADITEGSAPFYGFGGTSTQVGSASVSGGLTIGITKDDVAAFIRAVEGVTDVTVLANPKILATNKQLGQVYIGTKIAYQSQTTQNQTGSTTQQVSFLDTGTTLAFRPYIGDDGYIRMDIHPKDSSAALRTISTGVQAPDETSAEIVTNIVVKDGETIVIGGLFRDKVQTAKTQIPVLGNLPIVGMAFSSHADEAKREEVIVLLTPHIISEPNKAEGAERAEDVARKITGAKDELSPSRIKLAQQSYERAAVDYVSGRYRDALKELNNALELYPGYVEAIQLEEKIYSETDPNKKPVRKIVDKVEKPQSNKWRKK